MTPTVSVLGLALVLLLGPASLPSADAAATTMRFVGDIHGARAEVVATFEPLVERVAMTGRIQSGAYLYTFTADLVGTAGYGEMVDHTSRARFQIHIQLTQVGFALTANPLGPGRPTTYQFRRL